MNETIINIVRYFIFGVTSILIYGDFIAPFYFMRNPSLEKTMKKVHLVG